MGERTIFANAVLKDGKLMFWYTGSESNDLSDFNKDFLYTGLNMMEEINTGRYTLKSQIVKDVYDVSFYKQFELHEDFKGQKPY